LKGFYWRLKISKSYISPRRIYHLGSGILSIFENVYNIL